MSKLEQLVPELLAEIKDGSYGNIGDRFITVRELAQQKNISLKSAFGVFSALKENGVIAKQKKNYIINRLVPDNTAGPKIYLIGCIVTTLNSPYFAALVKCLEEMVHQFGACLLVASSEYDFQREKERINAFVNRGVSGLFVCPWADEEEEEFYRTIPVPAIVIGRKLKNIRLKTVIVNNQNAAQRMAAHLIDAGCDTFAYVGQNNSTKRDERLFGFRAELFERGVNLPAENIIQTDYNDHDKCLADIEALLDRKHKGRLGIFCYHDLYASRVMMLCHRTKLDIPGKILLAGFDDLSIAEELSPSLTTVRYPVEAIARIAAESLYAQLRFGGGNDDVCYVNAELVVRESTTR